MSDSILASYEELPYQSTPRSYTHPDALATTAALLGLRTPRVDRCRVLELGCSTGGNLLPMAMTLPEAHVVGIDLSPRQIAEGQAVVERLGVANLTLRAMSILDIDEAFGQFDYIICHGVFSWVPPVVREKILSICSRNLAPDGIAYVSYNTYPGWHLRGMVREMLKYHVRQFREPQERVRQARAFVELLASSLFGESAYSKALSSEADILRNKADTYIFHEHLEDENQPFHFHEFVGHAGRHGLQYVGEVRLDIGARGLHAPTTQAALRQLPGDLVQREQYLDFLQNRTFRRTLLCHAGRTVGREPSAEAVTRLCLSAVARPRSENADMTGATAETFESPHGPDVTTNNPVIKTAIITLFRSWPHSVPFADLAARVRDRLAAAAKEDPSLPRVDDAMLAPALLQCALAGLVELHTLPSSFVFDAGERPRAFKLARAQAAAGQEMVSNLRHNVVEVEGLDRVLLAELDGTRAREDLVAKFEGMVASGEITLDRAASAADVRAAAAAAVEESLRRLGKSALLEA